MSLAARALRQLARDLLLIDDAVEDAPTETEEPRTPASESEVPGRPKSSDMQIEPSTPPPARGSTPESVPPPSAPPAPLNLGTAGASARREYARRKATRETRVRENHPLLGEVMLALGDEPQGQRAWATGALGEEQIAAMLAKRCPEALILHDRRIPRTRANIDHIAVVPSGVWVIDTKRYKGKVQVQRPWFGPERLTVAGRDKSKLVQGVLRQVERVEMALDEFDAPPLHGALCFVDAEWPWFASPERIDGVSVLWPRALANSLTAEGPLVGDEARRLAEHLARQFPSA